MFTKLLSTKLPLSCRDGHEKEKKQNSAIVSGVITGGVISLCSAAVNPVNIHFYYILLFLTFLLLFCVYTGILPRRGTSPRVTGVRQRTCCCWQSWPRSFPGWPPTLSKRRRWGLRNVVVVVDVNAQQLCGKTPNATTTTCVTVHARRFSSTHII